VFDSEDIAGISFCIPFQPVVPPFIFAGRSAKGYCLDFPRHRSGEKQGGNPPPGGGGYEGMEEIKEERTNRLR
jgi:hypothetical protein